MNVGLIDVDSHNYPNLALMKISAWHREHGDRTEMCVPLCRYDIVYQSKIFTDEYSKDIDWTPQADIVYRGGTGYGLDNKLPYEIEHTYPDYGLYGITDRAYGFLSRGCPRDCSFCIVSEKEGCLSRKNADLEEFWNGQKEIVLMDPNLLACPEHLELMEQLIRSKARVDINQGLDIRLTGDDEIEMINRMKIRNIHFAWDNPNDDLEENFAYYSERAQHRPDGAFGSVYILTNYHTTIEQDLYRIYMLRDLGYKPFVMIYDKPHAPMEIKRLAAWCNNRIVFNAVPRYEDVRFNEGKLTIIRS